MKNAVNQIKKAPKTKLSAANTLHKKVVSTEKSLQKAHAEHENKSAAYEDGLKQNLDKITLPGLLTAAKIAKFNIKIKRLEHKLAKATWKAAMKAEKKSAGKRETAALLMTQKKAVKKAEKAAADAKPVKKKRMAMA